jgi:ABC-type phosphate transport system auxiliary subunit
MLETAHNHILSDTNQIRSQLAVTSQLTKDQATQIIDLERRLMQSNELLKTSSQRQALLEQQLRDLRLTSEKHQLSMQGQLDEQSKQVIQREDQIIALESINNLLKEELNSLKADNEYLSSMAKQDKDLAEELHRKYQEENEMVRKYFFYWIRKKNK